MVCYNDHKTFSSPPRPLVWSPPQQCVLRQCHLVLLPHDCKRRHCNLVRGQHWVMGLCEGNFEIDFIYRLYIYLKDMKLWMLQRKSVKGIFVMFAIALHFDIPKGQTRSCQFGPDILIISYPDSPWLITMETLPSTVFRHQCYLGLNYLPTQKKKITVLLCQQYNIHPSAKHILAAASAVFHFGSQQSWMRHCLSVEVELEVIV